MRMRTKLSIVTVVGAGALLLAVLASVVAPQAQIAYAQDPEPTVKIRLSTGPTITQGGQLFAQYKFSNLQSENEHGEPYLLCKKTTENEHEHSTAFDDPCYYKAVIYIHNTMQASACEGSRLGGWRSFSKGSGNTRTFGYSNNQIPTNCPPGDYTLKVYLAGSDRVVVNKSEDEDGYFKVEAVPPTAIPTNTRPPTATRTPRTAVAPTTADRHPNFDADSNIDADNNADRNAYS